MASHTFAMEAIVWLTSGLNDRGDVDLRLEAAMAKLFNTEVAWHAADELLQIRGGRGFETAQSLRARGEKGYPVERSCAICASIASSKEPPRFSISSSLARRS